MINTKQAEDVAALQGTGMFPVAVGLAVLLCIVCCAMILLLPTASINVDTVYHGF